MEKHRALPLPRYYFIHFHAIADIMSEVTHEKVEAVTEAGTASSPRVTGFESESELVNASGHVQEVDRK